MLTPIPQFTAPSYLDKTTNTIQRMVNLYPIQTPTGWEMVSTPGLTLAATLGYNEARGAHAASNGTIFIADDNRIIQVAADGTASARTGNLGSSTGFVSMADNGTQLFIVETTTGTKYTLTMSSGNVTAVADANCPSCSSVTFQDGYFIISKTATGEFYLSNLLDGTDWTPVAYATAESEGDILVAVHSNGQYLYLIGKKTVEIWYNTGRASFPFERINGGIHKIGGLAAQCITALNGKVYVFGSSHTGAGSVFEFTGTEAQRITNQYMETAMAAFLAASTYMIAYHSDGYDFLEISSSAAHQSFVYNISNQTWFQKESNQDGYDKDIMRFFVPGIDGTNIREPFAIHIQGDVYFLDQGLRDPAKNSEAGIAIRRERIFGPIESNMKRLFHRQIRFEVELKFDATGTTSVAPTLEWTDNDGLTYATALTLTKTVTSSTTGQRVTFVANNLGSAQRRYYRLTFTGPAAKIILRNCEIDLSEGRF